MSLANCEAKLRRRLTSLLGPSELLRLCMQEMSVDEKKEAFLRSKKGGYLSQSIAVSGGCFLRALPTPRLFPGVPFFPEKEKRFAFRRPASASAEFGRGV